MFCCSYTRTQPSIYHEYIFQLLQYRIIITACEEVLISVLHGCKRKQTQCVPRQQGSVCSCLERLGVSLATNDVTPVLTTS